MSRKPTQDFFLFLLGSALFAAGIFLFTSQVTVGSGFGFGGGFTGGFGGRFGSFFGGVFPFGANRGFGLLMIPFGVGVSLLLADTLRRLGWFLIIAASAALGAGILQSLIFHFRPASLFSLLTMIFMIGGGGGLMFRSLRGYPENTGLPGDRDAAGGAESRREVQELREELERLKARVSRDDLSPPG